VSFPEPLGPDRDRGGPASRLDASPWRRRIDQRSSYRLASPCLLSDPRGLGEVPRSALPQTTLRPTEVIGPDRVESAQRAAWTLATASLGRGRSSSRVGRSSQQERPPSFNHPEIGTRICRVQTARRKLWRPRSSSLRGCCCRRMTESKRPRSSSDCATLWRPTFGVQTAAESRNGTNLEYERRFRAPKGSNGGSGRRCAGMAEVPAQSVQLNDGTALRSGLPGRRLSD
jgi:hypothetical protein